MGTLMWLVALGGAFLSGVALNVPAKGPPATPEIRITQSRDACTDKGHADQLDCRVLDGPVIYRDLSPAAGQARQGCGPAGQCGESCPHD
ncbi:MAG: hypothetical protein OXI37_03865 [Gammaproteobacteria bacterium]|nr:hypothetical protein [Gammaproteobacteria bacterium]